MHAPLLTGLSAGSPVKAQDPLMLMRTYVVVLGLALLTVVTGCSKSPQDEAREKLVGEMGVPWSKEEFIQAAMTGHPNVVGLFLTAGMDPDTTDDSGKTALIWAARNGHADTVKVLLDNNADANMIDKEGKTALIWAAAGDNIACVQALLAKGANVNVKALDGSTASSLAKQKGNTELVKLFETAGARE
jgi:ankyrin repeat protein